MDKAEIWPVIHAERRALLGDLKNLGPDEWSAKSSCERWSVRDVAAHMAATARISPLSFFPKLAASGFSLSRLQDKDIAAARGRDPVADFEAVVDSVRHPPGPPDTWLGETIVHADDIRRPLGIPHDYPAGALARVADFYAGSNLVIGGKRRAAGLALRSTDASWSHGSGPEVSGPLLSLLLAMTGRQAVLADLAGEGVSALRSRG